jgi:CHAT domain-containing protein
VPEDRPITQAFEESMIRLGQELLEPLARELRGIDRIFVVPNGELHHVPFAALRLNGNLVVRERVVSVLPAAEVLLSARKRFNSAPGPALVVGDPAAGPDFPRLPGAAREARQVAEILGESATLLVGRQALEGTTRTKAEKARVIHLATHARVDPLFPSKSFVALVPGDGEDGRWTAEEIAESRIQASLVTLSGCRTALEIGLGNPEAPGDEREGLVRAFFKAGAGSIVANLWEVDDGVAQTVLPELYRRSRNSSPVQALSAVQRAMIRGTLKDAEGRALSHPFYWAGLVVYGADVQTPKLAEER